MFKFKFEMGQTVYFMSSNKIESAVIGKRKFEQDANIGCILYGFTADKTNRYESELFESPEALAQYLVDKFNEKNAPQFANGEDKL
jgi:hypothetical protein